MKMEYEADNTPTFRTLQEAYGHNARLHVPRNPIKTAQQWLLNAAITVAVVVFSILSVLVIAVLGLATMDVVLDWMA